MRLWKGVEKVYRIKSGASAGKRSGRARQLYCDAIISPLGSCRAHGYEIAAMSSRQLLVGTEAVARLTYGTYHIIFFYRLPGSCSDILNHMVGLIECRTYQIGHTGIDYHKLFGETLLNIKYAGDERTTLGHYRAPELKVKLLAISQLEARAKGIEVAGKVGDGIGVGMIVVNTEAASHIDALNSIPRAL